MTYHLRLLAAGLTTTLVAGGLGLAAPAAHAEGTRTFDYRCSGAIDVPGVTMDMGPTMPPVVLVPPMTVPLTAVATPLDLVVPADLGALAPGTAVPITSLSGTLGLGSVLATAGGLLATVQGGVSDLAFSIGGSGSTLAASLTSAPASLSTLVDAAVPVTGQLPAFTAPSVPGAYDLLAPEAFTLTLSGATVVGAASATGGLVCTLADTVTAAQRALTTLHVVAAGDTGGGGGTGQGPVGGGTTGTGAAGGTTGTGASAAADPCVTTPRARAGQRATRLTARATPVSWRRKPVVTVAVTVRRTPARGRVIVCHGSAKVGQRSLRHGRVTLRTSRLRPGRYRLRVVYLGSAKARPGVRTITLRVRR